MPKEIPSKSSRVDSLCKSVRNRNQDLAERLLNTDGLKERLMDGLTSSSTGWGLLIALVFALLSSVLVYTTRDQPLVAVGRVMDETRLVRIPLTLEDKDQTSHAREAAKQKTPRVYNANNAVIDGLVQSLENLPKALASAETLDSVDKSIRSQFALTPERLDAVKAEVIDGKTSTSWVNKVSNLRAQLRRRPLLDQQTYQKSVQEGTHQFVKLMQSPEDSMQVFRGEVVNVEDKSLGDVVNILARDAGFTGQTRELVVSRLLSEPKPTFTFDDAATTKDQNFAAESVQPVLIESPVGQVIFQRGQPLTQAQSDLFRAELSNYAANAESWQHALRIAGVFLACAAVTLALSGYTALFCTRIRNKASRMLGVAVVLWGGLFIACVSTVLFPQFAAVTSVAPTIFVAMLMCIAYDRRSALAFGLLHGLLVCVALRESAGILAIMISGIACVVWTLAEIRDRNSLFRTSIFAAIGVSASTVVFSLIERPLVSGIPQEIIFDCALVAAGTVVAGGVALFLLPLLERAFNVTTGLTLMELRDPKQPLLRELQQRAPGTYNHSLNVAAIAEAAAEAIGADSLLTYVGALYHDVGKMNKPEYFVENQIPGINKHDRLSPAMSLLIIVGHVKDGMELAAEFRLPRNIQHFIEAHHGTTLVEFFFARARQLARQEGQWRDVPADDQDDTSRSDDAATPEVYVPEEFEYRYPGPKPKTKECAILLICDAVESATRTLSDPTPSRIEALVRSLANKRLMDGQFDDCELTLRDLNLIVESISRTLASMFHARVSYPSAERAVG